MKIDTAAVDPDIQQLKNNWNQLSDLDRARAIVKIKKAGLSNRKLASLIDRNESAIRRLLLILKAPGLDQIAARKGELSTNELVRSARTELKQQDARRQKYEELERDQHAAQGAKLIHDWLRQNKIYGAYGESVLQEARKRLIGAYADGTLPRVDPPDRPVAPTLIIERCKPKEPLTDDILPAGWFGLWLARWLVFAFPNPDIRDKAIDIAYEQMPKR